MYRYDEFDVKIVQERIAEFSGQVARRMSGELTEDQFKPLRLMNGVYLQLHAYMLRVAVPYGQLNSRQMERLAKIARVYDKGYGHFTTRQNIQYNWPALKDVPAILQELADVEMHAIQTSGNCIRNVTSDQFAAAASDEVEDPRVWSEVLRQWSTFHPEFSYLPRKFKIAVTGAQQDRAAVQLHDIGIHIVKGSSGEPLFNIYVGGGQGRTPFVAPLIKSGVKAEDLLSYLEACLRVYNRHGRRDNIYKARIKILVSALGAEEYARQAEAEWNEIKDGVLKLPQEEVERIRAYFAPPAFEKLPAKSDAFEKACADDKAFARWTRINLHPHKQPGYTSITISLKPIGGIPGDASADQMDAVAKLAEQYSFDEVRVTHEQNLVLPHVKLDDVFAVWSALKEADLATPNAHLISDIIACPGLDYCDLANARSISIAQDISNRFADLEKQEEIGELLIKISGCINACGHHHVGHIGILGVDKHGEEFYQITVGGSADENSAVGGIVGKAVPSDEVNGAVDKLLDVYLKHRVDGEDLPATYRRVGAEPFKEAVYGAR
jgi:sulfite reductase (NADPH) hemoprotein beta-component